MLKIRNILKNSKKGFTLVELIVVIAILGILALIAVPRVLGSIDDAKKTARDANVRTLNGAIALYLAEDGALTDLEGEGITADSIYDILVEADVIQDGLVLDDITYNATDHAFE